MITPSPTAAGTPASPARPERRLYAIGLRLMAALCIATMMAGIKVATDRGVHVVETLFYRQVLALPIVLICLWLGPGLATVRTRRYGAHAGRAAAGLTGMVFNFLGVMLLPLAEATTIGFTAPIFATVMSALFLGERTGAHRWAAVAMGFLGMLIMVRPGGDHFPLFGAGIALTGAFMTAVVSVLLRQLSRTEDSLAIVFWFILFSLPPLALGLWIIGQAPHDWIDWGLLLLIGTSGGLGQIFLTAALKWAPVSVVLPMDYSSLVWATLFGWFIWSAWPDLASWTGAALIVASGLYIAWREHIRRKAPVGDQPCQ